MLETHTVSVYHLLNVTWSGAAFPKLGLIPKNLTVRLSETESWNHDKYFPYSSGVVMNEYFTTMEREN